MSEKTKKQDNPKSHFQSQSGQVSKQAMVRVASGDESSHIPETCSLSDVDNPGRQITEEHYSRAPRQPEAV